MTLSPSTTRTFETICGWLAVFSQVLAIGIPFGDPSRTVAGPTCRLSTARTISPSKPSRTGQRRCGRCAAGARAAVLSCPTYWVLQNRQRRQEDQQGGRYKRRPDGFLSFTGRMLACMNCRNALNFKLLQS